MPIRLTCKSCRSKIDAKDELRGQKRKCPKCGAVIVIEPDPPPKSAVVISEAPALGTAANISPKKLEYQNRYFVLAGDRLLASWENAQGWLFNCGSGFQPAKRNPQLIPDQGTYAFVELHVEQTDRGQRLVGLDFYGISARGALPLLARSDGEILTKLDGAEPPSRTQKAVLLAHLRKTFMYEFLSQAAAIVEYLANDDLVSTSIRSGVAVSE